MLLLTEKLSVLITCQSCYSPLNKYWNRSCREPEQDCSVERNTKGTEKRKRGKKKQENTRARPNKRTTFDITSHSWDEHKTRDKESVKREGKSPSNPLFP